MTLQSHLSLECSKLVFPQTLCIHCPSTWNILEPRPYKPTPFCSFDLSPNVSSSEKPPQNTHPTLALAIQFIISLFNLFTVNQKSAFFIIYFIIGLATLHTNANSMRAETLSVLFTMLYPTPDSTWNWRVNIPWIYVQWMNKNIAIIFILLTRILLIESYWNHFNVT